MRVHRNQGAGEGAHAPRPGFLPVLFTACAVLAVLLAPSGASAAEHLTASGCSISNLGYLTELAREYERRTGVKVYVRGGGSIVGVEDLRSGVVDFAASCRPREADDPEGIDFVQVAWDALVFVVHPSNDIAGLTLDQARAIYGGRIRNWQDLGGRPSPITLFLSRSRRGLSGVEASTNALVLQGQEPVETAHTRIAASTGIVEQLVEETPSAFATTGYTSARKRQLKMLKVNGVAPTYKTIINGRYPLKRPLFLLVPHAARPEVRRFVAFATSREGQLFLRTLNVVSMLDIK